MSNTQKSPAYTTISMFWRLDKNLWILGQGEKIISAWLDAEHEGKRREKRVKTIGEIKSI
ncbi:MAG: hypothetical protein LBU73_04295 [Helicobacteraceae bacterium]|nr:hypothetical protein [Helicobacteraceae bacterium]